MCRQRCLRTSAVYNFSVICGSISCNQLSQVCLLTLCLVSTAEASQVNFIRLPITCVAALVSWLLVVYGVVLLVVLTSNYPAKLGLTISL